MFCPQCKAEYRLGFTRCSDCDVPLVAALAPEERAPAREADGVEVFAAADAFEAETVKGLLETNGISVYLEGEGNLSGLPGLVSIVVMRDQAELALEILEEYRANLPDVAPPEGDSEMPGDGGTSN